jgi:hypothetical protein
MACFRFDVDNELTAGTVVGVVVTAPDGKIVQLYGDVALVGRDLIIQQFAIYGMDVTAGSLGVATPESDGARCHGDLRCR